MVSSTPPPVGVPARSAEDWATPFGRRLARMHTRTAARIGPRPAFAMSLGVGTVIAAASAFLAVRVYDGVADDNGIERLDRPALLRAKRMRSPALDGGAAAIARVFGPVGMPVLVGAAAAALSIRRRDPAPALLIGAAGAGALLMTLAGKDLIRRHRPPRRDAIPPYESSPSFPSGHTLNATTAVGAIAYLLVIRQSHAAARATTIATAATVVAGVGLSRVLLGAHWLSDVIMGWTTGTGWLALAVTSHRLHATARHELAGRASGDAD